MAEQTTTVNLLPVSMRPETFNPQPTDMLPLSRPTMQLGNRARKISLETLANWIIGKVGTIKGDKGDPGTPGAMGQPGIQGERGPTGVANARIKTVALPAGLLGINVSSTVVVTWDMPFSDDAYVAVANLQSASLSLATLQVTQKARTAASVTYQITNVGISLNLSGANLVVLAVRP
jgi:hypothetical protein